MEIFQEYLWISVGMFGLFGFSILCKLILGILYGGMLRETENMASTKNRLLRQCKNKFSSCYQLNSGVNNIPVFVDKFIGRLCLGPISFESIYHFSGQAMLFSVTAAGVGICLSISEGKRVGEILPFFAAVFLGMYLYFSVSAAVDVPARKRMLKINLVDYLENHLSGRMNVTREDMDMLYGKKSVELLPIGGRITIPKAETDGRKGMKQPEEAPGDSLISEGKVTEEELEALLKEFLA